jgi:hypothetical protein
VTATARLIDHKNSKAPLVQLTVKGAGTRTLTMTEVDALMEHHKDAVDTNLYQTLAGIRQHALDLGVR